MDRGAWKAAVHGVAKSRTRLSDFTFTFHFHAVEKEMATHSSVLAWRIPGMGELVGCLLWTHRVGHDWSDLPVGMYILHFAYPFIHCRTLYCFWNNWDLGLEPSQNSVWDLNPHEVKWSESCSAVSNSLRPHGQAMEFSRPEQPFPSPRDLPNPGIKPRSPTLQVDSLPTELTWLELKPSQNPWYLVSGPNEAQVLDILLKKKLSERRSNR